MVSKNQSLIVYFSIPKAPESNAGGPIAVAKLLMEKILTMGGKLRIAIGDKEHEVLVKLLVGAKPSSLDSIFQASQRSTDWFQRIGLNMLKFWTLEQRLSTRLGTTIYLLALQSWDAYKRFRLSLALKQDLHEYDKVIVVVFGLPSLNDFTKLKRASDNLTLLYYEQSKGGFARENRLFLRNDLPGKPIYIDYLRKADETVYAESDRCLFPSEGARKLCEEEFELDAKRIRIVYNGIPDYLALDESALEEIVRARQDMNIRTIVNTALHVPEKQVELFIEGASEFITQTTKSNAAKYKAINYGKYTHITEIFREKLRNLSKTPLPIDLKGGISHSDLINALKRAWAFISVPNVVVFDLALLEAMCLGLPIVATPYGGNVEALGEDYPLFAETSSEIATCLKRLAEDKEFYASVSLRNRRRYKSLFTLDKQISSLSKVIAEFAG